MVCLGNICRSPTAHGVLQTMIEQKGLSHVIEVDSAGTSAWHIGAPPDPRSQRAAAQRGYDLSNQRARQVEVADFHRFDYIFAMDRMNLRELEQICPVDFQGHLGLFMRFYGDSRISEVPDPYTGGDAGFVMVLNMVEQASSNFLQHLINVRPVT